MKDGSNLRYDEVDNKESEIKLKWLKSTTGI
jgi:hypothetical protein